MDSNTRGLVFHYSNGNNNKKTGFFGMNMNDNHTYCLYENVEIDTNGSLKQDGSTFGKLKVASPAANDDAATKKYVDDSSQWVTTTGSDNIYYDTGNVGVGVTSVSEKFEVATDTDSTSILGRLKADSFTASGTKYFQLKNNEVSIGTEIQDYCLKQDDAGQTFINSNGSGNKNIWFCEADVKFAVFMNKKLGIGTAMPECPLHITYKAGNEPNNTSGVFYYNKPGGNAATWHQNDPNSANDSLSIKAEGSIWTLRKIYVSSDSRIKKDIEDVNDNEALDFVNKIPCRKYFYKDRYTEHKRIGFMAQEVREHLPEAVNITKNIIPDEMREIENPQWTEGVDGKWILNIENLDFSSNHTGRCSFRVMNDETDCDEIELTANDDKKTFTFEKHYNSVFLVGKEVNNFHVLDKKLIFALHHAAIQEVDRQL